MSDNEFKNIINQLIPLKIRSTKLINETFELIKIEADYRDALELNNNEDIINFKNGIYNIKTKTLEKHNSKYISTIQIPANYSENVVAPIDSIFEKFIWELSNHDEEIRHFYYQYIAFVLSNIKGYRLKSATFIVGAGNTGKTQFKLLLTKLLGEENCTFVDVCDLSRDFRLVELMGKRLAGSNDMVGMKIANLDKFKQITGGDIVESAHKFGDIINFRFNGCICMCGNQMPIFGGDRGTHVFERMIIIPSNNIIPKEKRDKKILEKMLNEKDYIISKVLPYLSEVIENNYNFSIPQVSNEINKEYRISNDSVLLFIQECMEDRDVVITKDDFTCGQVHEIYKQWYLKNYSNNKGENQFRFRAIMEDYSDVKNTHGGNDYYVKFKPSKKAIELYCPNPLLIKKGMFDYVNYENDII